MITLKLFGEGCFVHYLESSKASIETYKLIAAKMKLPLKEALLDAYFFYKLHSDVQSIDDLIVDSFGGLLPLSPWKIEIWFERKKIAKIPFNELLNSTTLFPLYNVENLNTPISFFDKGIYLKELVTGCIGTYKFDSSGFDIDNVAFTLLTSVFTEKPLLVNTSYQNKNFEKVKDDYLIRHREIVVI